MCKTNRRGFLAGGAAFLTAAAEAELLAASPGPQSTETAPVDKVATDIYFHEGKFSANSDAVCNNGWILFEDYVLVIDANYPAGARLMIDQIRALTDKPIRFALDTHHHGDHAYGNQVYAENGAVPFAHTGVIEELKKYETGYYGGKPGRWEATAKRRADVAGSKLKPPTVLYSGQLIFDDGKHRVEVMHLGVAHTHGDSVAWLPKERILFTGDICVNGPYNNVIDGDTGQWVGTIEAAKKLGAEIICTGHGPRSVASVLDDQQAFFRALRDQVGTRMAGKSPAEAKAQIEPIRAALKANAQVSRFVADRGGTGDFFLSQIAKVYEEVTGSALAALDREKHLARQAHARSHGVAQV